MLLAGDVGGTKVNLGLFEISSGRVILKNEATRLSRNYPRFQDLVAEVLREMGDPHVHRACFGVAGPVKNGRAQLTNLPWNLDALELAAEFHYETVALINDLEANAYGLAELTPADLACLNRGETAPGNLAMISAGTGLGEAGMFWDGQRHHVFASEGGHGDFGPATELDAELFDWLRLRFGHVSWEKVLSGQGLVNLYNFLSETKRGEASAEWAAKLAQGDAGALITQAALGGTSSRCAQALQMFIRFYGAESGNLALKIISSGGLYIGGGIAPKILPWLQNGSFLQSFVDKGRMRPLLQAMPVWVVLNPKTALLGAAHHAAFPGQGMVSSAGHPQ